MKRWLQRGAIVAVVLGLLGFLVAASGLIPIRASSGHWPITEWALRFGMKRSIATHSLGLDVPGDLADPALIRQGARHYDLGCRSCHGEPGLPLPRIAGAMTPAPPELTSRIRESDARKLFYVVKHGIKFTGMPTWPAPERDDEVWAVVAFLLKYPALDEAGYRTLVARDAAASVTLPPAVRSCAACHGADGLGDGAVFPRLAGQRAEYLRHALTAYAQGHRHSGTMEPVAVALTAEAIHEVVRHYAPAPPLAPAQPNSSPDLTLDPPLVRQGRELALHGIPARRVPACLECHDPQGRRTRAEYPTLAGQPARYLELQLNLFKADLRGGSGFAHLMQPIASRLEAQEISAVAAYFASLRPADPATPRP